MKVAGSVRTHTSGSLRGGNRCSGRVQYPFSPVRCNSIKMLCMGLVRRQYSSVTRAIEAPRGRLSGFMRDQRARRGLLEAPHNRLKIQSSV